MFYLLPELPIPEAEEVDQEMQKQVLLEVQE